MYFQETGGQGRILHILVSKTDLLLLNPFEIPRCHKTCRLQKTKERFVWLIWSSVLLRCHKKMTISRRCFEEKCQPWKERKIGVSWNFHCSEICISYVIWQFIILTRTRNGELPFRPCSTFPLPDIAKITNRTKKENKKTSLFPVRVVNKECTYSGKEVPITLWKRLCYTIVYWILERKAIMEPWNLTFLRLFNVIYSPDYSRLQKRSKE